MKTLILLSALALTGCVTATGPAYSPGLVASSPGTSQLVIYRPDRFAAPRSPMVKINGVDTCALPGNSFMIVDAPKGKVTITSTLWDHPGTSVLTFTPDKESFVRMDFDDGKARGNAFGLAGALAANATSSNAGPFVIQRVYRERAESEMGTARQACQ